MGLQNAFSIFVLNIMNQMERKNDILKRWCIYLAGVLMLLHVVVPHHHHYNGVADYQHHMEQTPTAHDMDISSEIFHCDALDLIIVNPADLQNRDFSIAVVVLSAVLWAYHEDLLSTSTTITKYFYTDTRLIDRYLVSSLSHRGPPAFFS